MTWRSRSRSRSTSAPASPTRPARWRTERAVYVRPAAALQPRLPGRREHPALALRGRGGRRRLRARLAADHGGQPVPGRHGPRLLPPVRDRLQPRRSSTRRSASTRSSASSATRRSSRAGASTSTAAPTGKRVLVVGAGPSGLSAAYHLARLGHSVTIRDAGPARRRDDALRHPEATGCRATSSTPRSQRILDLGVDARARARKVTDILDAMQEGGFDAVVPRRRRAHRQARLHPRRLAPRRSSTPSRCCAAWRARSSRCSAGASSVYGGGNTAMDAARTAKRLGADEAIVVYRRTRDRMPAHDFEVEEAERGGRADEVAVHDQAGRRGQARCIERMELDETGFPQPTGELEELEADSLVLALGQDTDLSLLDGVPGLEVDDGVVEVAAEHDDRPPGHLRRRRHGARRAHRHGRRRPRQEGRPQHRRLARAAPHRDRRRSTTLGRASARSTPGTTRTRRARVRPRARAGPPPVHVRRGRRRARRVERPVRGAPLHVVRQLLLVRQLLRRVPGQRGASSSATRRAAYAIDLDYCKGCGICVAECPAGAIEMVPETI